MVFDIGGPFELPKELRKKILQPNSVKLKPLGWGMEVTLQGGPQ